MNMNDAFVGSLIFNKDSGGDSPIIIDDVWYGNLSEYKALSKKSKTTVYFVNYNKAVVSAVFIGDNLIYPVDENPLDYEVYAIETNSWPYTQTDIPWFNGTDWDIEFVLGANNYGGTMVLFGNSTSDPDFNMIFNYSQLRIYGLGTDQVVIGSLSTDSVYSVHKRGTTITIYQDDTLLETRTCPEIGSGFLQIFGWRGGYVIDGFIKKLTFKFVTE